MKRRIVAICLAIVLTSSHMIVNAQEVSGVRMQSVEKSMEEEFFEEIPEERQLEESENSEQLLEESKDSEQLLEESGEGDIQRPRSLSSEAVISEETVNVEKTELAAGETITVGSAEELKAALKAAQSATVSNPRTITIKTGDYKFTSALAIPSYVTLNMANGAVLHVSDDITINSDVTLNLQNGTIKYTGKNSKYALYIKPGVNRVSIAGGTIDGGGLYTNQASSISLRDTVFKNYTENGIYAKDSEFKSIDSVSCHGGIGGISLKQTPVSSIKNCRMQNFTDAGISLDGEKTVLSEVTNNFVIGISSKADKKVNGIYLKGGAAAGKIGQNTVNKCFLGIYLTDGAKASAISSNTVNEIGEHGIYLSNQASVTGDISGNTVKNFVDSGIQLYTKCTVKGKIANNKVQDGKGTGILITGLTERKGGNSKTGSVVAGNIENNEITNCTGDGIGIYHASHCGAISNNRLEKIGGNHNGNEGDYGIIVDSMMKADTYCTKISGNKINNVTYAAIAIYSGPAASKSTVYQDTAHVKGNIENNVVTNSGTYKPSKGWKEEIKKGGKQGCLSGIYVDTHARVRGDICNNTVDKTGEHGIYLHLMSFVRSIYSNTVSNTKEVGIEIYESTVEKDIYNNVINNAGTNGIAGGNGGVVKGKIRKNTIKNPKECGIYLDLSKFSQISENKISGAKKHGIYVTDKSTAKNILSNTISISNPKDGCVVKISDDSTVKKISKNTMTGKAAYGVRVAGAKSNMEISSNTMTTTNSSGNQYNPIRLMKGKNFTYTVKNNKLTGNKTNYGIYVDEGKAKITGNTVKKATYPIYVSSNKYSVTVEDNKISGCQNNTVKTAQKKISTTPVTLQSVKNIKGKKVTLSWKKQKDINNYLIYQSQKKGKSFKKVADIGGKTYTVTGLKKGKTYYYKVRGYQKDKKVMVYTDWSKELSVKINK